MTLSGKNYCVQVADAVCYFTASYLASYGAARGYPNLSDAQCESYATCGMSSCSVSSVYGLTCPVTPAGQYQSVEAVPVGYKSATLTNMRCFGAPGSNYYLNGRFCQMKLPEGNYCIQVADNSCYFTSSYMSKYGKKKNQSYIDDSKCENLAKCGS